MAETSTQTLTTTSAGVWSKILLSIGSFLKLWAFSVRSWLVVEGSRAAMAAGPWYYCLSSGYAQGCAYLFFGSKKLCPFPTALLRGLTDLAPSLGVGGNHLGNFLSYLCSNLGIATFALECVGLVFSWMADVFIHSNAKDWTKPAQRFAVAEICSDIASLATMISTSTWYARVRPLLSAQSARLTYSFYLNVGALVCLSITSVIMAKYKLEQVEVPTAAAAIPVEQVKSSENAAAVEAAQAKNSARIVVIATES